MFLTSILVLMLCSVTWLVESLHNNCVVLHKQSV